MVSIVIPVLNQWSYTEEVLASIKENCSLPHEIIVVDDGCTDGTPEKLKGYKVRYFRNPNKGVNAAWNYGVSKARGKYVWVINNDIVLTKDLDATLVAELENHRIACPLSTTGKDRFHMPLVKKSENICGWCYLLRKKDWPEIPESLDLWYGDDFIFHSLGKDIGWNGLCHHYESKTINSPDKKAEVKERIESDKRNWKKVRKEYGFDAMRLSILIPSVPSRAEKLARIVQELDSQATDDVEIVAYVDNKRVSL